MSLVVWKIIGGKDYLLKLLLTPTNDKKKRCILTALNYTPGSLFYKVIEVS